MPTDQGATRSSGSIMLIVAACLLPGLILQAVLFSVSGVLANLATAVGVALITERAFLTLTRARLPLKETDPSILVTALILALALPPGAIGPTAIATVVALGLGKHVYGGLGNNVFNPAMVGYAVVLVSFPAAIADWPTVPYDFNTSFEVHAATDALSGATALTTFKYRGAATVADVWNDSNGFGVLGGSGYEWVGLAFLAAGLVLIRLRLAAWRPAAGMLGALTVLGVAGYDNGSSASLGSPAFHIFSGSTLLAACFVVTDPVTHPSRHRDQWLFGLLVGSLTWLIRSWGNYPDGIAFAVLLGNALTPYLDRRALVQAESVRG